MIKHKKYNTEKWRSILNNKKSWEVIIDELTEEQITDYLIHLGSSPPKKDSNNNLLFNSICHGSNSRKLCYFVEGKNFLCFMEWESFNIFSLTMRVLNLDFKQSYKYVCNYFDITIRNNFSNTLDRLENNYLKQDWDIFEKYFEALPIVEREEEKINPNLLNFFSKIYYEGWIKDNISVRSMIKFDIRYSVDNNCIVIPHFNIDGEIVGIRGRFLEENSFGKYMPLKIENQWYTHFLTDHLYGFFQNKKTIKTIGKVLIFEGEKSVMQCETYFPDNNFTVAVCGKNISNEHIRLLLGNGVREVMIGMDSDFFEIGNNEKYLSYRKNILEKAKKLLPYFTVYHVGAYNNSTVYYKNSPSDMGKEYLLDVMKNKEWIYPEKIERELAEIKNIKL